MKRFFSVVALLILLASAFYACDSSATYAEQLADEKSSINAFISNNGFKIVDTIPQTVPWPTGVYYKTETGLYVHVLDTGRCIIDSIPVNTVISVRFTEWDMDGEETYSNMESSSSGAYEIYYNNVSESVSYGDCLAWHEGLDYVGDEGHIQMIVPASLGMSYYTTDDELTAVFYELRYTFWK
jgi:hypothetical protein